MMSGVPLETCWVFNKLWNNKFYYKLHLVGISTDSYIQILDCVPPMQACWWTELRPFCHLFCFRTEIWGVFASVCNTYNGDCRIPAVPHVLSISTVAICKIRTCLIPTFRRWDPYLFVCLFVYTSFARRIYTADRNCDVLVQGHLCVCVCVCTGSPLSLFMYLLNPLDRIIWYLV